MVAFFWKTCPCPSAAPKAAAKLPLFLSSAQVEVESPVYGLTATFPHLGMAGPMSLKFFLATGRNEAEARGMCWFVLQNDMRGCEREESITPGYLPASGLG